MAELKLPELGENITQGTVTKILVKTGDAVKKGQSILELETDKAVLEVPSSADGVVSEIMIKNGAVIKVGQAILRIEGGTSSSVIASEAKQSPKNEIASSLKSAPRNNRKPSEVEGPHAGHSQLLTIGPFDTVNVAPAPLPERQSIPAAPSVRLLARELGIDIAQVPGSGPSGRISSNDVKAYCKMLNTSPAFGGAGRPVGGGAAISTQPLPDFTKWGPVRREAMNNVRKKTAEHLSWAWANIPHVTQFDKADITELEKLRKTISGPDKKISITPFIIKVACGALKKFPQFNSSIDIGPQEIIFKDYVNIGIAVDTDRGLIVPVLKNADKMSLLQISDELSPLAERARLHKTTIEEMQGGCFTISNLGGIGGTCFTPIINWPQAAVLGVSRGAMEPVYIDGNFTPRLMLPLSLSYDHRIIDGADGARFLRWVCEELERSRLEFTPECFNPGPE